MERTLDHSYVERLATHMAILVAYEDCSLAHDLDRVMLAITFMQHHLTMLLGEMEAEAARTRMKE